MGRWLVVGALLLGCGNLSGLDDYSVDESAAPQPRTYLSGTECNSCVESKCGTKLAACNQDALCGPLLARERQCSDPNCLSQAKLELGFHEASFEAGHWPKPVTDLRDCARDTCRGECSAGRNWDCLGRYSWEAPAHGPRRFRHKVITLDESGLPGETVMACNRSDPSCEAPLASAVTGADGLVDFQIPDSGQNVNTFVAAQSWHLAFRNLSQKPRYDGELSFGGVVSTAVYDVLAAEFHVEWSPTDRSLWAATSDCHGFGADDVVYELWLKEEGQLQLCSECVILYIIDRYKVDPDRQSTRPDGLGAALFGQIGSAPGYAEVRAYTRSTGKLVAETGLSLAGGRFDSQDMYPLTTGGSD